MSESLVNGPIWDIKYGDNPMTGEYEYIGHRIELPNRSALVFAEKYDNELIFQWTSGLDAFNALKTVTHFCRNEPVDFSYYDANYENPDKSIILGAQWRIGQQLSETLHAKPEGMMAWRLAFNDETSFVFGFRDMDERVGAPFIEFGASTYCIEALKAHVTASAVKDVTMRIDEIIEVCEIG